MIYELKHHGIKGQRWGVRRFQNPDGSLTWAGRRRLKKQIKSDYKEARKSAEKEAQEKISREYQKTSDYADKHGVDYDDIVDEYLRDDLLKNHNKYGMTKSAAEHVIKYNEMLERAEEKEQEHWAEVGRNTVSRMLEKYGEQDLEKYSKEYRAEKERIKRLEMSSK